MKRVLMVRDSNEFEAFRALRRADWQEYKVYTFRPATCLELHMSGIPAHTLSEHISAVEAESHYRRAFAEATQAVEASAAAQGASLVQLARLFKVYYWEFLADMYALDAVLSRWDKKGGAVSIHQMQRLSPPVTTHPNLVDPVPLAEHVFKVLKGRGHLHAVRARSLFWSDTQRLARAWLGWGRRKALRPARAIMGRMAARRPPLAAGGRVIGWGSSSDALVVLPDMLQLAAETGLRPLLVTERVGGGTKRTGLTYRESYDSVERFSIAKYLYGRPAPAAAAAERQEVERAFASLLTAIDATEVGSKYRLSSYMGGLRWELMAGLLLAKELDQVLGQWAGSALVLTNFNGLQERIIEQLAARHRIHVYARPHGWLANWEGFEFSAAKHLVPGRLQAELLGDRFGYRGAVVKPDLNLTLVADEWRSKNEQERRAIAEQKRRSLGIEAKHIIVVLATMARNRIVNELDYPIFRECWLRILDYLKDHPEMHILVKAHPTFNYNPWLTALSSQQQVQNITVSSERLENVLGWADLVVDLGFPGTAVIATLLFRKPLLLYRGLYRYVRELGDITHDVGKAFTVDSPGALLGELDRFRQLGDAYLEDLRARNLVLLEGLAGVKAETVLGPGREGLGRGAGRG